MPAFLTGFLIADYIGMPLIKNDKIYAATGCFLIFCICICAYSKNGVLNVLILSALFGAFAGYGINTSVFRLLFSIVSFPLFFITADMSITSSVEILRCMKTQHFTEQRYIILTSFFTLLSAIYIFGSYI